MLQHRVSKYVMIINFRENWKVIAAILKGQRYWRYSTNMSYFADLKRGWLEDQGLTHDNSLQPEYHLPFYIGLRTFDHRATLTALERNLGCRKVTTHSRGRTLKSTQETTRGYQEVFSYQLLRQRSNTAIFQEHLMQFRPWLWYDDNVDNILMMSLVDCSKIINLDRRGTSLIKWRLNWMRRRILIDVCFTLWSWFSSSSSFQKCCPAAVLVLKVCGQSFRVNILKPPCRTAV